MPVSISALSPATLLANRVQDVTDLSAVTPSLAVRPAAGGSKIPQYSMRGIYTFGTAIGTDKGISLYIDGVYLQNVAGSVFEFADVERIEVLRGPQGTLFGRNSTGGAISVVTRDPTGEFGVRQDLSYGNYNQIRSRTRVNLPVSAPSASRRPTCIRNRRGRRTQPRRRHALGPASLATGGRRGVLTSPGQLGDEEYGRRIRRREGRLPSRHRPVVQVRLFAERLHADRGW
ncbi:TonB-dependent receptor plug domain-containing protein [Sphingomonas sp. MMS24-JH45]